MRMGTCSTAPRLSSSTAIAPTYYSFRHAAAAVSATAMGSVCFWSVPIPPGCAGAHIGLKTDSGLFEALQHRGAEMLMELEQARSMAMYAALMVSEPDPIERRRAMSEVKVQISKSGRFVAQQAVQLHGGIGVTEEYAVGHSFKLLSMMEALVRDSDHHMARLQTPVVHRGVIR